VPGDGRLCFVPTMKQAGIVSIGVYSKQLNVVQRDTLDIVNG